MKKFDIVKFNENKLVGVYRFISQEGLEVRQVEFDKKTYLEYSKYPFSTLEYFREYYADTLSVKMQGELFYGNAIGIWQEYDNYGTLIKETDWNKIFQYSIYDLEKLMKKIGIEIMKEKRYVSAIPCLNPSPHYRVAYQDKENPNKIVILIIDGNNGELLSKTLKEIDFD